MLGFDLLEVFSILGLLHVGCDCFLLGYLI